MSPNDPFDVFWQAAARDRWPRADSASFLRDVVRAIEKLLGADTSTDAAQSLRALRDSCLPGAEPSARAAKQLATLYAAVTRDRVHNGLIRLLVGILPTGSGKSFIACLLLPRLLDILYGREDTPMRCCICAPLKA